MLFEVFEPGPVPEDQEQKAVSYDPKRPLLVVRSLRAAKLTDDSYGVIIQLQPDDAKLWASLTSVYFGKFLILTTPNGPGEVLNIVKPTEDGVITFHRSIEEPVIAHFKKRLNLQP